MSFPRQLLLLLLSVSTLHAVVIDGVLVGNANNSPDPTSGFGSVSHTYGISKYETTISAYTEFLNSTASSDPYGLYNASMASDPHSAGIARSGSSGSFTYSVVGSPSRPITYVSWYDAARYANWLHNGQGAGSTETGAYNLNGAMSGTFAAQPGARVWLPTEDEWYKAAYYDPTPNAGGGDNYWNHAMQTDALVNNSVSANYHDGDFAVTQNDNLLNINYLTQVGAYLGQDSYYGTFDQGGNVYEWTSTPIFASSQVIRGGSWDDVASTLSSSFRNTSPAAFEWGSVGFRVAFVPEPSALALGLVGLSLFVVRYRSKKC